MVKYEATHNNNIKKIEIVKESNKSIWVLNRNNSVETRRKESNWGNVFDSWKLAHDYLIERAEKRKSECAHNLKQADETLIKIKAMKEEMI